ncbi:hypothetical protein [Nitrosomonas ureae]|uniref:Uncharacterized protein n=1 Tax=Nitrosomonas ureae TaxID=44577 RepID=A0A2T5IRZ7_9PROT|nr:hypothetical protein [Nitrosomonas ureae]PTQ86590.1 hypothetical protein C8R28_100919 [Nitrosomonas ureae]
MAGRTRPSMFWTGKPQQNAYVKRYDMWCDTKHNIEIASKIGKLQYWANSVWVTPDKRTKKNAVNLTVALNTFASEKADAWLVALAAHSQ